MGIVLDSSVAIASERRGDNVAKLLKLIFAATGDQEAVLSAIGLTELVHGIYRAQTPEIRARRELFIHELLVNVEVYAFTQETALLAGKIDGEQQARGITVPFSDLLIGATALLHGYSVLTVNVRDFRKIPGLSVLSL
jgi:predicted nucleic acid-binding protein